MTFAYKNHNRTAGACTLQAMRIVLLGLLVWAVSSSQALALPQVGHYFNGANGLMSAVPMPPGFTYVNNFFMYNTNTIKDEHGDSIDIGNIDVYVNGFTPIWTSESKVLGATYSCMVLVPYQNVEMGNFMGLEKEEFWGVGDILVTPVWLTWQVENVFVTLRYGFFAPTGRYGKGKMDNIGLGYWTNQIVGGLTWVFGPEKSWHLSSLNRIELHTQQMGHNLTPGPNFISEWGFGKEILPGLDIGITGYANVQVASERGTSPDVDHNKYQVFALGGEIGYHVPDTHLMIKARCSREFGALNHTEGWASALTIAYKF